MNINKPEHYTVDGLCSNCGWSGCVQQLRGHRVNKVECPRCGCHTVIAGPKWPDPKVRYLYETPPRQIHVDDVPYEPPQKYPSAPPKPHLPKPQYT